MVFNKRGVSTVVATVLLILVTLAAFAILAGFIVPFVRDSLEGSTTCTDYSDYFQFEESFDGIKYNCFDGSLQGVSVSAKSVDEEVSKDIGGFELVFILEGDSQRAGMEELLVLGGLESRAPKQGEIITYSYSTTQRYNSVEIYPLLKSGDICELSDSINIIDCEDGVNLAP